MKADLTSAFAKNLEAPAAGQVDYWDTGLTGFGIRVASSGKKTWQVFYRVNGI
jgi:hypothetical protein